MPIDSLLMCAFFVRNRGPIGSVEEAYLFEGDKLLGEHRTFPPAGELVASSVFSVEI